MLLCPSQAESHLHKSKQNELPDYLKRQYLNETTEKRAEVIFKIAEKTELSPTAISLAYLLHNQVTCLPSIGVSSVERLKESLQVFDLPQEYRETLENIS